MSVILPDAPALLLTGMVVHARLRPKPHRLAYRVFSILADLDRLPEATAACRSLSYNRRGALALYDRDHFAGRDEPLGQTARRIFRDAGFETTDCRVLMLAYPRILGFTFNPLTVHLLVSASNDLEAVIYEVSNTFGERHCYVEAAGEARDGTYTHGTHKSLYVSPFAQQVGRYTFHLAFKPDDVVVGVAYRDRDGPLIRTHMRASPEPLSTAAATRALFTIPALTAKVVAGIHWEALKLWLKGVPLTIRTPGPAFSVAGNRTGRPIPPWSVDEGRRNP
jgi:uncharacterized protein